MGNFGKLLEHKNMNNNTDSEKLVYEISGGNNWSKGNWNKGLLLLQSGKEFVCILPMF